MSYDVFIFYSRQDDEQGRVSQLVELIVRGCEIMLGRPLRMFFDKNEAKNRDDWVRRRQALLERQTAG